MRTGEAQLFHCLGVSELILQHKGVCVESVCVCVFVCGSETSICVLDMCHLVRSYIPFNHVSVRAFLYVSCQAHVMPGWSHPHVTNMSPPHTTPHTQTCAVKFSEYSRRGTARNQPAQTFLIYLSWHFVPEERMEGKERRGAIFAKGVGKQSQVSPEGVAAPWCHADAMVTVCKHCACGKTGCIQYFLSFIVTGRTNRQSADFTNTLLVNNTLILLLWEQVEEEYNQMCQTGSAPHSTSSPFIAFLHGILWTATCFCT